MRTVQTIPTSGLNAIADECFLSIPCVYEEDVSENYEGLKWWQSEDQDLFIISSRSLDAESFIKNMDDTSSQTFANMIND